jgi:transposase-like protein
MRWVHQYGPEIDKRVRCHLKKTNDSWRVDETYIKVKGQWMYLYRSVDSEGSTIDFYLSKTRDHKLLQESCVVFSCFLATCHNSG